MVVLSIDPGKLPGYALSEGGVLVWADWQEPAGHLKYDVLVIEGQHAGAFLYRNGKRVRIARGGQNALSFTAGRLFERFDAQAKYTTQPDSWRAVLWPGSRRLPKPVVLARLKELVPARFWEHHNKTHQPDVLEACGLNLAWLRATPAQRRGGAFKHVD